MSSSEIRVWDLVTGVLRLTLDTDHPDSHFDWFSFSPDGRTIACVSLGRRVSRGGLLRTFGSATGVLRHAMDIGSYSTGKAEFSPDSRFLVSQYGMETLMLHYLEEGVLNQQLNSDLGSIWNFKVSPDSKFLAFSSDDGTLSIFELSTGYSKTLVHDNMNPILNRITALIFSADSRVLASVSLRNIRLWDPVSGVLQYELEAGIIIKTRFSPDGSLFVAARSDRKITILSCVGSIWEHVGDISAQVNTLAFLPDSTALVLACGSHGGILRLWDLADRPGARNHSPIVNLHLSPNGQILASRSGGEFIIWDTMTGIKKYELKQDIPRGYDLAELPVAFSHDSRLVALICPSNAAIMIWNVGTGTLKKTIYLSSFFPAGLDTPNRLKRFSLKFDSDGVLVFDGERVTILWDSRIGVWRYDLPYNSEAYRRWSTSISRVRHLVWKGTRLLRTLSSTKKWEREDESQGNDARGMTSQADTNISLLSDQWIALNDERVLWLPPEFRHAVPTILVDGAMVALANISGNVLFLRFSA